MESSVVRSRFLFLVPGADCEFKRKQGLPVCVQRLLYAVALPSTASLPSSTVSLHLILSPPRPSRSHAPAVSLSFSLLSRSRRSFSVGSRNTRAHASPPVAELLTRSLIRQSFAARSHGEKASPHARATGTRQFPFCHLYITLSLFF